MTEKKKTEPKQVKPVNDADVKEHIDKVIDQLAVIAGAREVITEHLKYLKSEYGLSATNTRKAAETLFKSQQEELVEKNEEVIKIIDICS
jgi:hypothetical protein